MPWTSSICIFFSISPFPSHSLRLDTSTSLCNQKAWLFASKVLSITATQRLLRIKKSTMNIASNASRNQRFIDSSIFAMPCNNRNTSQREKTLKNDAQFCSIKTNRFGPEFNQVTKSMQQTARNAQWFSLLKVRGALFFWLISICKIMPSFCRMQRVGSKWQVH